MQPKTEADFQRAISLLQNRIGELKAYDVNVMQEGRPPELKALEDRIARTLERVYGDGTNDLERYLSAAELHYSRMIWTSSMPDVTIGEYRQRASSKISAAVVTLESAIRALLEDAAEVMETPKKSKLPISENALSRRVFVVHGRDEAARESVARFLMKIDVEPIILHEQASRGQTVLEKIFSYSDVDFAVVILTPDDIGGLKGEQQKPRARQNVMLELGFFLSKLGRARVCALRHGEVDIPTDFAGTIWTDYDANWQVVLARELGSGLIDYIQKMTVAAMQMADMKVCPHRS